MQLENGKMVYGRKDCMACNQGKRPGQIVCTGCCGKGKIGRKRCFKCNGSRMEYSWDHSILCPVCQGQYQGSEPETRYDYMPPEIWDSLTFKVYRQDRGITFNEANLGFGCVFSCADYGTAWETADERTIEEVKQSKSHQACKIVDENDRVCDHIGIFINRGGYAVKAIFS